MKKIFNLTSSFKAVEAKGGLNISGMASTADFDRAGDVIIPDAWKKGGLTNFTKNPIILFNHNYDTPIGKATNIAATDKGLELEAFISESAPGGVGGLIKDGVLGAFSVGFRIKDADYIEETGGLLIKDAELFEVSVVSVPCNQDATFSLAKSFESDEEYEDYKKTFTHSVALAGQSLAKDDRNLSNVASGTPDGGDDPHLEIKMDKKELEAFAKKVAEDTALKIALDQAKKDAATKKAAEVEAKAEAEALISADETKEFIVKGIQSGTEKLLADFEAKLAEKDVSLSEALAGFKTELEEKTVEIAAIRDSKRVFSDRTKGTGTLSDWGTEFLGASLIATATGKGMMDSAYAKDVMEKAGVDYTTNAPLVDQEIANTIEKEVQMYTDVTGLFRNIPVNGKRTVLPIQPDAGPAQWQQKGQPAGNLTSVLSGTVDPGANQFEPSEIVLSVYRLISQTFMDNDVDEEILIPLMPMLIESVARAHALATDSAIVLGNGGTITGLDGFATDVGAAGNVAVASTLTSALLFGARKQMGKYGIKPSDVTYIVSMAEYYNLIDDGDFEDVQQVGNKATKLAGAVGSVYGSPVVVSDSFDTKVAGNALAFAVNTRNFAIPRLRSITVEQDYEVGEQRKVLVASQSLGFSELVGDYAGNLSSVSINYKA